MPGMLHQLARGGWRTYNSCVLGKQSIHVLLSLSLPSLGIHAQGGWGCGDRSPEASPPPEIIWEIWAGGQSHAKGHPSAPARPRLQRGLLPGEESRVMGCTVPPIIPGGVEPSPDSRNGASLGSSASLLPHPSLLRSPVPRPAGTRLPVRGGSDEVIVLNIAISSQPFSPATRPGCRRLPALAEPPAPPPPLPQGPAGSSWDAEPKGRQGGHWMPERGWTVPGATVPPSGHRGREDGDARHSATPGSARPRSERHAASITSPASRAIPAVNLGEVVGFSLLSTLLVPP